MIKYPHLGGFSEDKEIDVNVIISGSKLSEFFPPQAQLIPKQRRDLCGYEIYI